MVVSNTVYNVERRRVLGFLFAVLSTHKQITLFLLYIFFFITNT